MENMDRGDVVGDPVGHISISGVHGRKELDERLRNVRRPERKDAGLGRIVAGMLIGAVAMYLLDRKRGVRRVSAGGVPGPQNGA